MKKGRGQEAVLFGSIVWWFFLASVVGAVVGLATTVFLKLLTWGDAYAGRFNYYYLVLPAAMFVSSAMIKYLAPDAEGHGTEKVIEAVHKRSGRIKIQVVPVKLAASLLTIICGGSVGKEGPAAQIGAGLSGVLADLLKFDSADRKKLVICGVSAGFASVFGTPLAGAVFGIEVLFIGNIMYEVIVPCFIAGMTAYQVSSHLGIQYFDSTVNFVPVFTEGFFIKVALSGVFFGLCSLIFIEAMDLGNRLSARIRVWPPLKAFAAGLVLLGLTWVFSGRYLGLGLGAIQSALETGTANWYDFPLKTLFTSLTLNFGGSGGIITPIFFMGSTAGSLFGNLMGMDVATFAAIGFVACLAGCANTPIAASIMAVEMFGPGIAHYAAVACVISYIMTGHRSVYPPQIIATQKSALIDGKTGVAVEEIMSQFQLGKGRWAAALSGLYQKAKKGLARRKKE